MDRCCVDSLNPCMHVHAPCMWWRPCYNVTGMAPSQISKLFPISDFSGCSLLLLDAGVLIPSDKLRSNSLWLSGRTQKSANSEFLLMQMLWYVSVAQLWWPFSCPEEEDRASGVMVNPSLSRRDQCYTRNYGNSSMFKRGGWNTRSHGNLFCVHVLWEVDFLKLNPRIS